MRKRSATAQNARHSCGGFTVSQRQSSRLCIAQLPQIEQGTPGILSAIEFNPGQRYGDFNPTSDKVATYGLTALVAGGVAAKLGLFKGLWIAILAAKKFVIIGLAALAAWARKFLKRKAALPNEQAG